MDFPQHKLRTNHRSERPSKIIFLDTETRVRASGDEELHTMRICWTAYWSAKRQSPWANLDWRLWTRTYPLCRYLQGGVGEKECLWIVGHNVFFDLQACDFFHYLPQWGWELVMVYDSMATYILIVRNGRRTIKVISTTNYYDYSLAKLGGELDLPKMEVEFGRVGLSSLIDYCRRDVEILIAAMQRYLEFIDAQDAGGLALSRAGQAYHAYTHRHMRQPIYIHEVERIKDLERAAYHGGRTEAFALGRMAGGPYLMLDVHSMYPYLMRSMAYPVQLVGYRRDVPLPRLAELMSGYAVVARGMVSTPDPIYAVEQEDKIIFPTGTFHVELCTGGILTAMERGHLKEVSEVAFYRRADLFSTYVDQYFPLRVQAQKDKDRMTVRLCKILLNSLYGKWGEQRMITYSEPEPGAHSYYRIKHVDLVTGQTGFETHLFNRVLIQLGREDTGHTMTAIAAHVTEYGRLLLYSIIEGIGRDRVLYCDTDSVIIRESDLHLVKHPIEEYALGSLGVQKRIEQLELYGAKDYMADHKRIVKGIPLNARHIGVDTYEYMQFLGQISHMRGSVTRGVVVRRVTKKVSPYYDKGIIGADGIVSPYQLQV